MTVSYATLRDVYDLGLSARAFVVVPRPLDARAGDSLDFATGTFWQSGHGIADSALVWLGLIARGGTNALPGGSGETTTYHGLPVEHLLCRLSLSEGGSHTLVATSVPSIGGPGVGGTLAGLPRAEKPSAAGGVSARSVGSTKGPYCWATPGPSNEVGNGGSERRRVGEEWWFRWLAVP